MGLRALVADDCKVNRLIAVKFLQMLGFSVDGATNGLEAVDLFRANQYSLILMDCMMPEVDGYAATAVIREIEQPQDTHVPIIGVTAHGDRQKCVAAGMDDIIEKPLTMSVLSRKLRYWLGVPVSMAS